jgi:hypothetical protein
MNPSFPTSGQCVGLCLRFEQQNNAVQVGASTVSHMTFELNWLFDINHETKFLINDGIPRKLHQAMQG